MYKIHLDDGTVIEATLNANTWESEEEIDPEVFEGNTTDVSYETDEDEIAELGDCNFVFMGEYDGKWMFGLNPLTEEEITKKELNQTIDDLMDAILEMSEVVYGGEE